MLTASQRAAHALREAAEPDAAIHPLASWMRHLWQGLLLRGEAAEVLLNRTQEHALWRDIIDADADLPSLRSADSLAEMAASAWRQLCLWCKCVCN